MKIDHDIHTHTFQTFDVSDPRASVRNYVARAARLGLSVIGISNYVWDSHIPTEEKTLKGHPEKYALEIKYAIPEDTQNVRVLIGAECDYLGLNNVLAMTAETAALFDYVIIRHSQTQRKNITIAEDPDTLRVRGELKKKLMAGMPEIDEGLIDRMLKAIKRKDANAISEPLCDHCAWVADFLHSSLDGLLAHPQLPKIASTTVTAISAPFIPVGYHNEDLCGILKALDLKRAAVQFAALAALDVAVIVDVDIFESNKGTESASIITELFKIAHRVGCRFAFGSNANSLDALDSIKCATELADILGITEESLIELVREGGEKL